MHFVHRFQPKLIINMGFCLNFFMIILIKWAEACFSDIMLNTDRHYFTIKKLPGNA